ncbi:unnamed protein product [Aphanomyces euteiches]
MGRKRGAVWNEFTELPESDDPQMKMPRVECKHCKTSLSKSSSRAVSHLRACPKFVGDLPDANDNEDRHTDPFAPHIPFIREDNGKKYHPVSRMIDHTLLKVLLFSSKEDISDMVLQAYETKRNKPRQVKVCCVVGFPLGASTSEVKAFEASQYIEDGADEIDMVIAIGKLKSGDHAYVVRDISAVVSVCKRKSVLCKAILETALLTENEIETASRLAISAGVDFIKTSTGFSSRGASVHDVMTMTRLARPHNIQVKASGGIRTEDDAEEMIQAGATRLGTSAGLVITKRDRMSLI